MLKLGSSSILALGSAWMVSRLPSAFDRTRTDRLG